MTNKGIKDRMLLGSAYGVGTWLRVGVVCGPVDRRSAQKLQSFLWHMRQCFWEYGGDQLAKTYLGVAQAIECANLHGISRCYALDICAPRERVFWRLACHSLHLFADGPPTPGNEWDTNREPQSKHVYRIENLTEVFVKGHKYIP